MPDEAANQTNKRMRDLDRRLKYIYSEAQNTAIKNQAKAIEKLAAFDPTKYPDMSAEQIRAVQLNYARQVERTTGIVNNIAAEIAKTAETAKKIIDGERLNVYGINYHGTLSSIDSQLGFDVDWSLYDKNQLRAILDGEQQPFGMIKGKETYNRSKKMYERAVKHLGDNKKIVSRLQNELAQSVILGESVPKIATRIKKVGEMSRRQAVTIARTEVMRVANQGRMLGFEQAADMGIEMDKQWIATLDNRTRDSHADMHGEKAELDKPFSNGLMQPGDANGAPKETINCRCTVTSVLSGLKGSENYHKLNERIGINDLNSSANRDIIEVETDNIKIAENKDVQYIGEIDKNKFIGISDSILTDEVVLTEKQEQHIIKNRAETYERYKDKLNDIIENPDFILKDPKHEDTALIIKKYNNNAEIVLKLSTETEDKKNSIITLWEIKDARLNRYLTTHEIIYKK